MIISLIEMKISIGPLKVSPSPVWFEARPFYLLLKKEEIAYSVEKKWFYIESTIIRTVSGMALLY